MEPVNPLSPKQEVRLKLAAPTNGNEVVIYLVASDAGDGNANDFVLWQQPKLVVPGQPDLLLRDVRDFSREMTARREKVFAATAKCLAAAAELSSTTNQLDVAELSLRHGVDAEALTAWLDYLGIGARTTPKLDYFTNQIHKSGGYDFVNGWGSGDTPLLLANSSDQPVRIPGNMKAHGVTVHPSPHPERGRRLAQSARRHHARRGEGDARASRMRQWRHVVPGTAARRHPSTAGHRHGAGQQRSERSAPSKISPCRRATWFP